MFFWNFSCWWCTCMCVCTRTCVCEQVCKRGTSVCVCVRALWENVKEKETVLSWHGPVCCSELQCVQVCWTVLHCVALCIRERDSLVVVLGSVLQCGAVCCNCCSAVQCGAVKCSVLQRANDQKKTTWSRWFFLFFLCLSISLSRSLAFFQESGRGHKYNFHVCRHHFLLEF